MFSLIFDIIGVKYDIFNFTTEQYIDSNWNGLYFCCENLLKDNYYSTISTGKKKLLVNLKAIQITNFSSINYNKNNTYDFISIIFNNEIFSDLILGAPPQKLKMIIRGNEQSCVEKYVLAGNGVCTLEQNCLTADKDTGECSACVDNYYFDTINKKCKSN